MANCNPVVPVMYWTEDAKLHKRYIEWKEEVELELGSSLSNRANTVKSIMKEQVQRPYYRPLKKRLNPGLMKLQPSQKLCSLKQGDMPLSEFIWEARRLAELCNYPNDQDRLIRDTIVSRIQSLRAYQKCIDAKDLSLQDCINICQVEDAIRMQVLECRPEPVKSIQSAQTAVPVHKLQNRSRQSPNSNRHRTKTVHSCYYCGAQNWTREDSKVCKTKNYICGRCGKTGHLDSPCRSTRTPLHMLEAQHYSHPQFPQSRETPQDYNQSLGTAQYLTLYFMSKEELPQMTCNSLKTVQVSRLSANEQSEQI